MKKILYFAAALAVMVTVSCNKEMNPSDGISQEGNTVKVTMKATADDLLSKVTLSGKRFEWEVGDQLQTTYYTGSPLTAISAGSGATFEGEASEFPSTKGNMYVFYTVGGTVDGARCIQDVPSTQSGLSTDIKNYGIWSSWVTRANQRYLDADGNVISQGIPSSVEIDAEMVPNFSVLKFTAPQELGLTSIAITADAEIAGTLNINAARKPTTTGNDSPEDRISRPTDSEQYSTITVSRNGEVISGDVYVVIAPDAFDFESDPTETSWELYYNTATTLKFTFTNDSGEEAEYEAKLANPIQMGELKNLGSFPVNIMTPRVEAGELRLTDATTLTVGVENPNPACTYHYEIGASKTECKTPTTASASFDPSKGFCPAITGPFDRYFIKVLAHTDEEGYRDAVLTASLRNWQFKKDCPVDQILSQVSNGTKLPEIGDSEMTSHGLELYRNTRSNDNKDGTPNYGISYDAKSGYIQLLSARVQINAFVEEYASDVWVSYYVDKNICVGKKIVTETDKDQDGFADDLDDKGTTGDINGNDKFDPETYYWPIKRGYRLFYNNIQGTNTPSYYWSESVESDLTDIREDGTLPACRYNMCINLTEKFNDKGASIKKGDKFGLRGDGQHVFYGMAMLEVL